MLRLFSDYKQNLLLVLILLTCWDLAFCQRPVITAVKTGSWNVPSTWDLNRLPQDDDIVVIPKRTSSMVDSVLIDQNIGQNSNRVQNMTIHVFGKIWFVGGTKIWIGCLSQVIVYPGAYLWGNNTGSKIDYSCGPNSSWEWNNSITPTLGYYYIGNPNTNPLPVELLFFKAENNDKEILLTWATASEKNNDFFLLERAIASGEFVRIGIINGSGYSNIPLYYSFNDPNTFSDIIYYRLTQFDYDGTSEMIGTIAVQSNNEHLSDLILFQNPVQSTETIEIILLQETRGNLNILSSDGSKIYSTIFYPETGKLQLPKIKPGLYLIQVATAEIHQISKLIVY